MLRAPAQGIRVHGAALTPFGGNTRYDDPAGEQEAFRHRVNAWIRTPGHFMALLDFDRAVCDPSAPGGVRRRPGGALARCGGAGAVRGVPWEVGTPGGEGTG